MCKFNWDAVGAIGQWAGAIGTVWAVFVALNQNKSKVRLHIKRMGPYRCDPVTHKPTEHIGSIKVTATNKSMFPVEITTMGYRNPGACITAISNEAKQLPKLLQSGESISLIFNSQSIRNKNIERIKTFYACDSTGRTHYQEANIIRIVQRFLWWNIGKYFKRYRNQYKFEEP